MPKEGWPLVYVPTYNHDLRIIPWPIKDKQYNIFIALRVFHHMIDKAEECFNEMCRISDFIILVLPEWGAKVYREIRKPSHEITNLGYIWDDQTAILFYDVCTYKIYSKIKIIDGLIYKKIIGNSAKELIEREIYWLKKLESYDITPKVIKFFDDTVVMTYCGEPLNAEQLKSPDIQNQILKIIGILLENECFYTDLTYHNFLILNGKVRIIDFEWCSLVKEDFTCDGAINSKIIKRPLGRNFDLFKII
jgi:predicted Ser/Thr protein kinase